jgi:hypothetical protein
VVKPASLCDGSMTQVPVRVSVGSAVVLLMVPPEAVCGGSLNLQRPDS